LIGANSQSSNLDSRPASQGLQGSVTITRLDALLGLEDLGLCHA